MHYMDAKFTFAEGTIDVPSALIIVPEAPDSLVMVVPVGGPIPLPLDALTAVRDNGEEVSHGEHGVFIRQDTWEDGTEAIAIDGTRAVFPDGTTGDYVISVSRADVDKFLDIPSDAEIADMASKLTPEMFLDGK